MRAGVTWTRGIPNRLPYALRKNPREFRDENDEAIAFWRYDGQTSPAGLSAPGYSRQSSRSEGLPRSRGVQIHRSPIPRASPLTNTAEGGRRGFSLITDGRRGDCH